MALSLFCPPFAFFDWHHAFIFFFVTSSFFVNAAEHNTTIDDTSGDQAPSKDFTSPCLQNACPDPSKTHDRTWTYIPTQSQGNAIEITVEGTGIYVYFIVRNTRDAFEAVKTCIFTLDGTSWEPNQLSLASPDNFNDPSLFLYDQRVFYDPALPFGKHTLVISSDYPVLFDYVIYTVPVDDNPGDTTTNSPISGSTTLTSVVSLSTSVTVSGSPETHDHATSPASQVTTVGGTTIVQGSEPGHVSIQTIWAGPSIFSTVNAYGSPSIVTSIVQNNPPTNTPTPSSSRRIGFIVGGVVGGVALLVLIGLSAFFILRCVRRRRQSRPILETLEVSPPQAAVAPWVEFGSNPPQTSPDVQRVQATSHRGYGGVRESIRSESSMATVVVPPLQALAEMKDIRRYERQMDIFERTRNTEMEIIAVQDELAARARTELDSRDSSTERSSTIDQEEQLHVLKDKLKSLRDARESAWAQGLTDVPPPGWKD